MHYYNCSLSLPCLITNCVQKPGTNSGLHLAISFSPQHRCHNSLCYLRVLASGLVLAVTLFKQLSHCFTHNNHNILQINYNLCNTHLLPTECLNNLQKLFFLVCAGLVIDNMQQLVMLLLQYHCHGLFYKSRGLQRANTCEKVFKQLLLLLC